MKLTNLVNKEEIRYLLAGAWNTVFGYFLGVGAYLWLSEWLHIIYISILANIIAITMSFFTYKVFVFRTTGGWLKEYLKIYLVYGLTMLIGTMLIWLFVNFLGMNIWLGQGLVLLSVFIISYILNRNFTFKKSGA